MQTYILMYFGTLSAFSFVLAGYDKAIAGGNHRRISERAFYILAILGGSPGLLLGMNVFRHKTRKASFQFVLGIILLIQAIAVFWLLSEF